MRWRPYLQSGLIILLAVLQLSLVRVWPGLGNLNLLLVVLVFLVVLAEPRVALPWWLVSGLLLDLFSFKFFGLQILLMGIIFFGIYFLVRQLLTNRSLYVFLLLVAIATVCYDLVLTVAYQLSWQSFLASELQRLGLNLLATVLIFYLISFISYRLRPVFLIRDKK